MKENGQSGLMKYGPEPTLDISLSFQGYRKPTYKPFFFQSRQTLPTTFPVVTNAEWSHSMWRLSSMGSRPHLSNHPATHRSLYTSNMPSSLGTQAQCSVSSRLRVGPFINTQEGPWASVPGPPGKARPTSQGHNSCSGELKQAEPQSLMERGLAKV